MAAHLLDKAPELESAPPEEVLRWAYATFERVAIVASFQLESTVLIDMACQLVDAPEVITLDTGRLPEETHHFVDRMLRTHRFRLHVETPEPRQVREMTAVHGMNLFYGSLALRRRCCRVRKGLPLARALRGFDAWVTGLRRDQTALRAETPVVAIDARHGDIVKIAPLAAWTAERVREQARARGLEHHPLYDRGYTSIGCAPCTRPTVPGEDPRAGRWWWERDAPKECGLHWPDGLAQLDGARG
jgi:phosphoadenylyl-sulfate reductase (thioredoxin)